ncbi:MAG TPA: NAD(P)-dependent oxidoreductase [Edaphocola sp.]|nr:NAD(P)-dependent oxidoreductase [Edaphocola sp.]
MNKERKALILAKIDPILISFLEEKNFDLIYPEQSNIRNFINQNGYLFEGIVMGTYPSFDKELIDACPQLKWVARVGSGMDHIDYDYAIKKGIFCCSSPEGNANAVAEQALGLLLALSNNIFQSSNQIKNGIWEREGNRGFEIDGKTAGIIGLGNNGYHFAKKLADLGMKVFAFDIEPKNIQHHSIIQVENLSDLYQTDVISFHVPYTSATHHYFNETFLEEMKHPFVLLNLCRGKVVDQEILYKGLVNGKIRAAAIDVWEIEPLKDMPEKMKITAEKLLNLPNFIGTSHIGGYSFEAITKMSISLKNKLQKNIF